MVGKVLIYKQILLTSYSRKCMEIRLENLYLDIGAQRDIAFSDPLPSCLLYMYMQLSTSKLNENPMSLHNHIKTDKSSPLQLYLPPKMWFQIKCALLAQLSIISKFIQKDGRKKRTTKRSCVTNVSQGYYLCSLS